jgi:outer membrane protein assembly factor BamA
LPASIRDQLIADLKEHAAQSAGSDWREEWNEVAITGAWMDEGFFKMTSTAKAQIISSDATEQRVSVTVYVDEGMQYRLRDIRFAKKLVAVAAESMQPDSDEAEDNGQTTVLPSPPKLEFHEFDDTEHLDADLIFPPEELRKRFLLNDGDVLDASRIKQGLDTLNHLYGSRGYIDFAAKPETITDDKSATMSLIMVLDEGKQVRVGKVEAYNLGPEKEDKLKAQIQPGDIYGSERFGEFFTENQTFIPALQQNEDNGTIDLQFGFPTCP